MEYFDEVFDRKTGELVTVSAGDWITVTEAGRLFGVGRRQVRAILRRMGVLVTEGAARHQRHRLAAWVVRRGWGRRIEKRGTFPFDVLGPELVAWIKERWQQTTEDLVSEATARSLVAREALMSFQSSRGRQVTVQQQLLWLADFWPDLTQPEMAMIVDVTQQLVSKYLNSRSASRRRLTELREAQLPILEPEERRARRIAGLLHHHQRDDCEWNTRGEAE